MPVENVLIDRSGRGLQDVKMLFAPALGIFFEGCRDKFPVGSLAILCRMPIEIGFGILESSERFGFLFLVQSDTAFVGLGAVCERVC